MDALSWSNQRVGQDIPRWKTRLRFRLIMLTEWTWNSEGQSEIAKLFHYGHGCIFQTRINQIQIRVLIRKHGLIPVDSRVIGYAMSSEL